MSDGYGNIVYGTNVGGSSQSAIQNIPDSNSVNRMAVDALVSNPTANPVKATIVGGVVGATEAIGQGTAANTVRSVLKTSAGATAIQGATGTVAAPVIFSYGADATKTVTIYRLDFFASCTQIAFNGASFLHRGGALPNGILVQVVSGGVTTTIATLKINEDFLTQLNNTDSMDFVNYSGPSNTLMASHKFTQPLVANSTDKIQVAVQDNLLTLLGILNLNSTYTFNALVAGVKS